MVSIQIYWLNVKWFEVRQSNPRSIFVNYTIEQDNLKKYKCRCLLENGQDDVPFQQTMKQAKKIQTDAE